MSADDVPLDTVGVPLSKLAAGIVTGPRPPDLVRAALADIAAEHGPAVARRMMVSAFTGGAAMVTGLPSMATAPWRPMKSWSRHRRPRRRSMPPMPQRRRRGPKPLWCPMPTVPFEAAALLELVNQPAEPVRC